MTVTDPKALGGAPAGFEKVVLLDNAAGGLAFMPGATPLTRLNYYDGKFLRADDLSLEQRAQRMLVQLSNQAGGPGVVQGFDVTRVDATKLRLSPGLALDPQGRILLLPVSVDATLTQLLDALAATAGGTSVGKTKFKVIPGSAFFAPCELASAAAPGVTTVSGTELYLVCISYAEGLCGNEEVFGRLCEEACVTATDRPYRLDGILLKLVPLSLHRPLPTSTALTLDPDHLRSRVASAYFGDEWDAGGSLLSATGLRSTAWCRGATALPGNEVPLGVLARNGTTIAFLDEWTARRERMEAPPRAYWAGRMEMRPWAVFLAQVLQFQCQLRDLATGAPPSPGGGKDPCGDAKTLLGQSTRLLQALAAKGTESPGRDLPDLPDITVLVAQVAKLLRATPVASDKLLVDGGIVELPPAGYLPVDPADKIALEEQVRLLVGKGLDLRFCAVRRDQVAHELERAQHMDRISLLTGLDDTTKRQRVDILVPDGEVVTAPIDAGKGFAVDVGFGFTDGPVLDVPPVIVRPDTRIPPAGGAERPSPERPFADVVAADPKRLFLHGAGRLDLSGDGLSVRAAVAGAAPKKQLREILRVLARLVDDRESAATTARRIKGLDAAGEVDIGAVAGAVDNAAILHRVGPSRGNVVSLDAATGDTEVVSLWVTVDLQDDPFTRVPNDPPSPLRASLDAFVPSQPSVLVALRFDGALAVVEPRNDEGEIVIRVNGVIRAENTNLSGVSDTARPVDATLMLTNGFIEDKDGNSSHVLLASGAHRSQGARAFLQWFGSPIHALAGFGDDGSDRAGGGDTSPLPSRRFVEALMSEDSGIAGTGDEHHDRAVEALTILQGARPDEKNFLATALAQLFPTAAGGATGAIRPTTDWVLFRRCRREDCSDDAAPPPPPPPSLVATWVATAKNAEEATKLATLLRKGEGGALPWKELGTVEFKAKSATLRTSPVTIRGDWKANGGGSNIAFAGYARNGAGVDPVGQSRAQALVNALAPAATLDAGGDVDLVAEVPPSQRVSGTDASALFVSYTPPEPVVDCVEVILVEEVDEGEGEPLQAAILKGDPTQVAKRAGLTKVVGTVAFKAGQQDDGALKAIKSQLDGVVATHPNDPRSRAAVAWIHNSWAKDGHQAEATDHAQALAKQLSASLSAADVKVVGFERAGRCPVLLYVMLPRIQPG